MKDYGINLINHKYGHKPLEPKKLICPICGTEFESTVPNRKYCSKDCAKTAQSIRQKRWIKDNYEHHKSHQREYQRRYREKGGEAYKEYRKKYYQSHKEELRAYAKKYYQEHLDEKREYARNYQKNHYGSVGKCRLKHNNCFSCPTQNGECLYE